METVLFFVFGATALAGALGVVLARNPVHSALFLVQTLVSIAVYFIVENAELLAAVQVIVYAGAIVVLFLFVIMLIGVDRQEDITDEPIPFQRPLAVALGVAAFVEVLVLAGSTWATGQHTARGV
ncbi:MAG: NADH-quinone oxidoreductase subunit J, partial [Actinobacteria bacterium]|nr:NADH-quinone oxidoreductase subunit J [Actinomycetota bacterium]